MNKNVTVVGGGLSGLFISYYLVNAGYDVQVLEKSGQLGGLIHTELTPNGVVESAANGLMNTVESEKLFCDLGLPFVTPLRSSRKRYIFRDKPRQWPLAAGESVAGLGRLLTKGMLQKRKARPRPGESVEQWCLRVLGQPALTYLVAPALQGIYAGNPEKLSASLILGRFFNKGRSLTKKKPQHKGLVAPPSGMRALVHALREYLEKRNVKFFFSQDYFFNKPPDHPHVVCTGAKQAAGVVRGLDGSLAAQLAEVEMLPLTAATLFFPEDSPRLRGFGCLFPREQKFNSLGVSFNDFIFPGHARTPAERWILGGANASGFVQASRGELLEAIHEDRKRLYGTSQRPLDVRVYSWPEALPHYTVGLEQKLETLRLPQNVYLCGNYLGSLGLSRLLDKARNVAGQIEKQEAL